MMDPPKARLPEEFTLATHTLLKPRQAWIPPLKLESGELDGHGIFHRANLFPFADIQCYGHQLHAECLLENQKSISHKYREFELIFPALIWRDNSNFTNGPKTFPETNLGYLCCPMLRWHWYDNEWALEWYWFVDGLSKRHLLVDIPWRWQTENNFIGK